MVQDWSTCPVGRGWGLVHLGLRMASETPNSSSRWLQGCYWGDIASIFTAEPSRRNRGNRHKLRQEMVRLEIGKSLSSLRTAQQWDRLPRGAVPYWSKKPPSTEVFKTQLDNALSNCRCDLRSVPAVNRRLDWRLPELPSHLSYCSALNHIPHILHVT